MAVKTKTVTVEIGDSLRRLAVRHLGDASRWVEIAEVNALRPPYIVESIRAEDRLPATRIFGDTIQVPLGQAERVSSTPVDVFGIDVALSDDRALSVEGGDYALVSGSANLGQALRHRVSTPTGDILQHADYGCSIDAVLGLKSTALAASLAAGYIKRALSAEPRVAAVTSVSASVSGNSLAISTQCMAQDRNTTLDLNFVYPVAL